MKSCEDLATLSGYIVDDFELPIYFKWKNEDVLQWMNDLGFPQYQNTFKSNFINGRTLLLIDAPALVKMNIKDFGHIKTITKEIRRMYKFELETFNRSLSLPLRNPETLFKFYKIPTGPIHELCSVTGFFKKMKLMGEVQVQLNHFEKLHKWLKHVPDLQNIRIGGIRKINMYFVKSNPNRELEKFVPVSTCKCTMGICECNWTDIEKRKPWRMGFLVRIDEEEYDKTVCDGSNIDLILMT